MFPFLHAVDEFMIFAHCHPCHGNYIGNLEVSESDFWEARVFLVHRLRGRIGVGASLGSIPQGASMHLWSKSNYEWSPAAVFSCGSAPGIPQDSMWIPLSGLSIKPHASRTFIHSSSSFQISKVHLENGIFWQRSHATIRFCSLLIVRKHK